ncbi:MAG: histidine phosphatase family protein [Alphaproteobacteria bacterium]|nr:histidine phosphatase family protein [Alphaproteobacteria bacterium]
MRKDFYIFRHGQTDYNKERRWQGSGIDIDLNEEGVAQAKRLAMKLEHCGLEYIYSSNLQRALHTAQIVASQLQIGVDVIPDLREVCLGKAEGLLKSEVAVKYAQIFEDWYNEKENMNVRFPNGESKEEAQTRMFAVLENLLKQTYKTIGIASHGGAIRYLLYKFGLPPHRMENTALYHIIYEDGDWRLSE